MNDTDISYYRSIDVLNRIDKERKKMKLGTSKFSRIIGKCDAWWAVKYGEIIVLRLSTVHEIAKKINVSMEFLMYGKNYGPYKEINLDVKKIAQYTRKKTLYLNVSLKSIISRIRNDKQKDIGINTFFQIEENINKNLLKIISNS